MVGIVAAEKRLIEILSKVVFVDLRDAPQSLINNMMTTPDRMIIAKEFGELDKLMKELWVKLWVKRGGKVDKQGNPIFEETYHGHTKPRKIGIQSIETGGGATPDIQLSKLDEDFIATTADMAGAADIPNQMLLRSDKLVGYEDLEPKEILGADTIRILAEKGMVVFRTYSYSDNSPEFDVSIKTLKEVRAEQKANNVPENKQVWMDLAISTTSPMDPNEPDHKRAWPVKDYVNFAIDVFAKGWDEKLGENIIKRITIKDAIGVLTDEKELTTLLKALEEGFKKAKESGKIKGEIPEFWTHTHGEKPKLLAAAFREGSGVDLCNGALSGGTSHTNVINFVQEVFANENIPFENLKYSKILGQLNKIAEVVEKIAGKYDQYRAKPEENLKIENVKETGVGGGATSGVFTAVKAGIAAHGKKVNDVFDVNVAFITELAEAECKRIRGILGEPQTLTPYSKNVGEQAVANVFKMLEKKAEFIREGMFRMERKEYQANLTPLELSSSDPHFLQPYTFADEVFKDFAVPLKDWLETVVGHACSKYGEKDRGYKRGKADEASRAALFYGRTFHVALEGKPNGTIGHLSRERLISLEAVSAIKAHILTLPGVQELHDAYMDDDKLKEYQKKFVSVEGKRYKTVDPDGLESIKQFILEIGNKGCFWDKDNNYHPVNKEAAKTLLKSLIPGKPIKAKERLTISEHFSTHIIEEQIKLFKEKNMEITLPLVPINEAEIKKGNQVRIPDEAGGQKMAVDRRHIKILIANARNNDYSNNTAVIMMQNVHKKVHEQSKVKGSGSSYNEREAIPAPAKIIQKKLNRIQEMLEQQKIRGGEAFSQSPIKLAAIESRKKDAAKEQALVRT